MDNQQANNPRGNVITPEMVMAQVDLRNRFPQLP